MNESELFLTIIQPQTGTLNFKLKTLASKEKIWVSHIKLKNRDIKNYYAFKVMSTASDQIKSYPFVGMLKQQESKSIKLVTKEPIVDTNKAVKIRIVQIIIEKPYEIKDQYEIMDLFKQAKDQIKSLPYLILPVQGFIVSETLSYITLPSDKRISMFTPHMSQVHNNIGENASLVKSFISQKHLRDSMQVSQNAQMEQSIQLLQKDQQSLIDETRELNKQIVLFKAKQNIPFEEVKDDQVKFSLFQLIIIAIISLLIGFYISEF